MKSADRVQKLEAFAMSRDTKKKDQELDGKSEIQAKIDEALSLGADEAFLTIAKLLSPELMLDAILCVKDSPSEEAMLKVWGLAKHHSLQPGVKDYLTNLLKVRDELPIRARLNRWGVHKPESFTVYQGTTSTDFKKHGLGHVWNLSFETANHRAREAVAAKKESVPNYSGTPLVRSSVVTLDRVAGVIVHSSEMEVDVLVAPDKIDPTLH